MTLLAASGRFRFLVDFLPPPFSYSIIHSYHKSIFERPISGGCQANDKSGRNPVASSLKRNIICSLMASQINLPGTVIAG